MAVLCVFDSEYTKSGAIIELGYVFYDTTRLKKVFERSILVKPAVEIEPYITELTGITEEMVKDAPDVQGAYKLFVDDLDKFKVSTIGVSWGVSSDFEGLRRNLECSPEEFYFKQLYINLKAVMQVYCLSRNSSMYVGVDGSLKILGREFVGRQHRALPDALNTCLILEDLIKKFKLNDTILKEVQNVYG